MGVYGANISSKKKEKKNDISILDMSITHCIFDLDGLLLDTESIYTECLQKLCAPYGKNFTTETKLKMMGKSSLEAGRILISKISYFIEQKIILKNFIR